MSSSSRTLRSSKKKDMEDKEKKPEKQPEVEVKPKEQVPKSRRRYDENGNRIQTPANASAPLEGIRQSHNLLSGDLQVLHPGQNNPFSDDLEDPSP